MNNHISIDVTNAKKCAVPKEKFRIINFNVGNGNTIEDLVHNEPPYFHFQVLRPESKEQADKAINYFKEQKKNIYCICKFYRIATLSWLHRVCVS